MEIQTKEFILNEEEALKKGFEEARQKGKLFNLNKWKLQREKERTEQGFKLNWTNKENALKDLQTEQDFKSLGIEVYN